MQNVLRHRWFVIGFLTLICCWCGPAWSAESFLDTVSSAEKLQGEAVENPLPAPVAGSGDVFKIFDDSVKYAKVSSATDDISSWKAKIYSKFQIKALDGIKAKWTASQLSKLYDILAKLPAAYRSHTKVIVRDAMYKSKTVLGYVKRGIPTVHVLNAACVNSQYTDTIVHEMMHVYLFKNKNTLTNWAAKFWPNGPNAKPVPPSVNSYGNTQPEEDLCESVAFYFSKGKTVKKTQSARYEFIKKFIFGGKEF